MEGLTQALFLALINNRIIEFFVQPVKQKYPTLDLWWLVYVSAVTGGLLTWLTGTNLFPGLFSDPLVGRILTAVVVGGGANLINDIFKR